MRLVLSSWFFLFMASIAQASAWSREEGALFIAAGENFLLSDGAELPVHYDPTLYAEYGATESLTLGLDLHTADAGRIGSVFFFASFPIGDPAAQNEYAANFALGVRVDAFSHPET